MENNRLQAHLSNSQKVKDLENYVKKLNYQIKTQKKTITELIKQRDKEVKELQNKINELSNVKRAKELFKNEWIEYLQTEDRKKQTEKRQNLEKEIRKLKHNLSNAANTIIMKDKEIEKLKEMKDKKIEKLNEYILKLDILAKININKSITYVIDNYSTITRYILGANKYKMKFYNKLINNYINDVKCIIDGLKKLYTENNT